jgi:aryl-alcohol dehydrogenase-like predicted oxidoreductase
MEQLKTDIDAAALELDEAVLEEIDQIHLDYPNPCP